MTTRPELYGTLMLTRREIARYLNVWGQTVVPPVVSAALFLFVFGHALGDRIGDFGGVPYLTFLVPGLVVQGAITNAFSNTASSLFDARRAGYIDDVLTSPLRDWQIALAYAVSGASRGVLVGILTMMVAWPVAHGWDLHFGLFLAVLIGGSLAFSLVGILAGLAASRWDHVIVPQTFLLTPLTFLGGVFYPVSELPADLATASKWNPLLYLVDAQRASVLGIHDLPLAPSLLGLGLAVGALYWIALWRFQTSLKLRG